METIENTQENEITIPKLKFNISVPDEIIRITNTLKKLEWYRENNYKINFPKELDLENATEETIQQAISSDFDISFYEKYQSELEKSWIELGEEFIKKLRTLGLPVQNNYLITLTRYGVGGSYGLPNRICLNIDYGYHNIIETILHEIIHLTIENLIKEYNIDHWTKERLVNLIYNRFYPEKASLQTDPKDKEKVQEAFDKYFPDIKKVIIELSKQLT